MGKRLPALGLFLGLVCVASSGCKRPPMPVPSRELPEVEVAYPVTDNVIKYEVFTGKTESPESVMVRARVTGHLEKVCFKEGALVKAGDVLFELDARLLRADLARVKASLNQAEAHLRRLDHDVMRARRLHASKAMSQEEYDKIIGDREEAYAAVEVARANLAYSEQNLAYTKVRAPISGRTGRNMIDRGNLVKADDTVMTAIGAEDPMEVNFDLDERTVLSFQRLVKKKELPSPDQAALDVFMGLADEGNVEATSCPRGFPHKGKIHIVDNKIDPSAGTLRVWGIFENKDRFLVAGLFVRVYIPLSKPQREILVAEASLGTDQGQKFLYVVNDAGEVVQRPVELGQLHEGLRVIKSGLSTGDRIIVNGLQQVRSGSKVRPVIVDMPRRRVLTPDVESGRPAGKESGKPAVKIDSGARGHGGKPKR